MSDKYIALLAALQKAEVIGLNGRSITEWGGATNPLSSDDQIALVFSYLDYDGDPVEYSFSQESLKNAIISGSENNVIQAIDVSDRNRNLVTFVLFNLTACSVKKDFDTTAK